MFLTFALSPFFLLFILMAVFNRPAYIAGLITAITTGLGAYFIWQLPINWIGVSLIRGFGVTIEIMFIIFGAIFLVSILTHLGVFKSIEKSFIAISKDKRVLAILIGWFFVGFMEGIAGFGTPALLAIPIFIAIGFKPLTAVILSLVGDSAMVVFGAVGLPITIGIAQGVGLPADEALLLASKVAVGSALINLILSPLIPLALILIAGWEEKRSLLYGLKLWPLAVLSGIAFMLPSLAAAYWLGPEFPTIIGSVVGVIFIIFILKKYYSPESEDIEKLKTKNLIKIIIPYGLIILLLFLTRIPNLPIGKWLTDKSIIWPELLGTGVSLNLNLLYSPGLIFLIVAIFTATIYRTSRVSLIRALKDSGQRISLPFWGLLFILTTVQILILSGNNLNNLPSIPFFLAEKMIIIGAGWPFLAPFIGALGSFISGGATISNLLFASLQYNTAEAIGLSAVLILSLQVAGGAVGNMIAVHNILVAQAVAGIKNKEGYILRRTIIPMLIYTAVLGLIGLLAVNIF